MKGLGLYIHIPFCIKKCDYCDFVSYCDKNELVEKYINVLKNEININLVAIDKNDYKISTIYIGGGTPSSIDSKYIIEILETIKTHCRERRSRRSDILCNNIEITIEINPGTITKEKLIDYKNAGINRLSIGLQETNNELLKQIGRIHTYEQFLETYNLARNIGFKNINVDLMIGLPNQKISDIKNSLNKIINLKPEHISVYSLILEEGTKLYKKYEENKLELPDEELERNMYWYVKNTLENNGYIHYEISNFAKEGYESKHNISCWKQEEYIGLGAAAHSYIEGVRYSNTNNIEKYINTIENLHCRGLFGKEDSSCITEISPNLVIHEKQNIEDKQKEYMLLGLRKINGISIQEFKNKFGDNPIFLFRNELSKLVEENLIKVDGDIIKLTNKGLDLANQVWREFI